MDFSNPCISGITQTKVNAHVIGRQVAAAAEDITALTDASGIEINSRSYRVPWTLGAVNELQVDQW